MMNIPPVANNETAISHNPWNPCDPWGPGELPPGRPMPLDHPFVKSLELLFPRVNSEELSKYAYPFYTNMMKMLSSQIAYDAKKARERARKMKEAL
jgi:hypothetical protein